ncbi:phospholipid transport system substrate-binding protein [Neisseria sp. HSC-16F19]|nr:ABC transporter substrate-binding protein [Neisseria sp. HSC-16F19]MCP2040310.1 phospholipid transport system substrate-binding protein [Neisseria sp. HSC-16F19]
MNRLLSTALIAPMVMLAPYAAAQSVAEHPAQIQLQQNVDAVLNIARNRSLSEQQKIRQIERYADGYLDYQRISALAVGRPWQQFTPAQKNEFVRAFKDMMIRMYARSALMGANDAKVKVLPKVVAGQNNRVEAFTEITTPGGQKYTVSYSLYKVGSVYKAYDFKVSGSSLVTVYRSQFAELIRQQGIDGTIATLKQKGLKQP